MYARFNENSVRISTFHPTSMSLNLSASLYRCPWAAGKPFVSVERHRRWLPKKERKRTARCLDKLGTNWPGPLPSNSNDYYPVVRGNVLKIVPVIKSSDLERSLHLYTEVLDLERKWPGHEDREMANGVVDLLRDGTELQLLRHSGDGVFGSINRVFVNDVDERYATFRTHGLNTTPITVNPRESGDDFPIALARSRCYPLC